MAYLGTLANVANKTAGSAFAVTTTSSIPAGTLLFMAIGADNIAAATPTISSITTAGGGTWTSLGSVYSTASGTAAGDGTALFLYYTTTETTVNNATTLSTVTFSGSLTSKAINVVGFSDTVPSFRGSTVTGTSTAGTPTATHTSPTIGDFVLGVAVGENNAAITGDADTTNGTWSAISSVNSTGGSAATNIATGIQYKEVTATGSQTFNPTTSGDAAVIVVDFIPYIPMVLDGGSDPSTGRGSQSDGSLATRQVHVVPLDGGSNPSIGNGSRSFGALAMQQQSTFIFDLLAVSNGSLAAGIKSPISASGASTSITSSASVYATLRPSASGASTSITSTAAIKATLAPIMVGASTSTGRLTESLIIRFTGSAPSVSTGFLDANRAVGLSGSIASTSAGTGAIYATLKPILAGQSNSTGTFTPVFSFKPVLAGAAASTGTARIGLITPGSMVATSYATGSAAIGLIIRNNSASGHSVSSGSTDTPFSVSTTFIGWGSPL